MGNFNINNAIQFLQGYLSEQDRIKAQKKIDKLINEENKYDINTVADPMSGQIKYQLQPKRPLQMSPYEAERIAMEKQKMGQQQTMLNQLLGGGQMGGEQWQPAQTTVGGITFQNPEALRQRGQIQEEQKRVTTQIAKTKEVETEVQAIDNMVESIYNAADRLIPAVDSPKEAEKLGMKRIFGSMSIGGMRPQRLFGLSNEDVIAYNEIMKAEATPIIRSMGEKGMLTNQDIQRALGLFAKNSDSTRLRNTRREELKKFLKSKVEAFYKRMGTTQQPTQQTPQPQDDYSKYLQAIGQ